MLGPGHAAPLAALVAAQPLVRGRVQPVRHPLGALRESAELDGLGPERHRQDHAPAALLHGDGPLVPRAPLVPRDEESNAAHAPLGDDLHRDAGRGGVDAHRLHPGRHLHGLQRPGRGLAAPPSQGPPGRRGEGLSAHVARRRPPGVPAQDVPVGPAALVRPAVGQGAGHLPLRALALAPGRLLAPPHPAARSPRRSAAPPACVRLSRRAQPASYCPGPTSSRSSSSPAPGASTPSPNSERHGQSAGSGKPAAAASSSASLTVSASPGPPPRAGPRGGATPPVTSGSGPPRARPSPSSVRSWSSSCRASCEKCAPRRAPRGQRLSALRCRGPGRPAGGTATPSPSAAGPRPQATPGPGGAASPPGRGASKRSSTR